MVSLTHEGVIQLIRDRPRLPVELLKQSPELEIPAFTTAKIEDATLNQLIPSEARADTVIVYRTNKPVFGVIVEVQLERDRDKPFTWPLYAVAARARHRCPFAVVVVTPSHTVARWASKVLDLGGGNRYQPLVIGPQVIPKVTDAALARRKPQLAVMSVIAHGEGPPHTATEIGVAAARAIKPLGSLQRELYSALIEAHLSAAARKAIEMHPGLERFFSDAQRKNFERGVAQGRAKGKAEGRAKGKAEGRAKGKAEGRAEGKAEGRAEGKAEALLKILMQRNVKLTALQRRSIEACTDLMLLDRWLDRALTASSSDELFAVPRQRSGADGSDGLATRRARSRQRPAR